MERKGVSHPIPTKYAKRIYFEDKNVFVSKTCLSKVSIGDKFIIYESHGAKAYTGWADIKSIGKQSTNSIFLKYNLNLILSEKELKDYTKGYSMINVIEFENFEKFKKPILPKRFVSLSGKYIYEDEYEMINKNKV